jgi:hypothetical protein
VNGEKLTKAVCRAKAAVVERIALILKSHGFEILEIGNILGYPPSEIGVLMAIGQPQSAEERANHLATAVLADEKWEA